MWRECAVDGRPRWPPSLSQGACWGPAVTGVASSSEDQRCWRTRPPTCHGRSTPTPSPRSVPANQAVSPHPLIQSMSCLNACSRAWLKKQHVRTARMWPSGWLTPTLEGSACLHHFLLLSSAWRHSRAPERYQRRPCACWRPSPGLDVVVHLPGFPTQVYTASHTSSQSPVCRLGHSVNVTFLFLLPRARGPMSGRGSPVCAPGVLWFTLHCV